MHSFSVLVCIDACFTQKHNHQTRDPIREHPNSYFIPPEDVQWWQDHVEKTRAGQTPSSVNADDQVEAGLKVPNSVLNTCGDSFTAADGERQKASTKFFDSTALMALLCCHDRVLWLVNMTTAGERQFYALALLAVVVVLNCCYYSVCFFGHSIMFPFSITVYMDHKRNPFQLLLNLIDAGLLPMLNRYYSMKILHYIALLQWTHVIIYV